MNEEEQFEKAGRGLAKQVNAMSEGAAKTALFCALLTFNIVGDDKIIKLYEEVVDTYQRASKEVTGRA